MKVLRGRLNGLVTQVENRFPREGSRGAIGAGRRPFVNRDHREDKRTLKRSFRTNRWAFDGAEKSILSCTEKRTKRFRCPEILARY